MWPFFAPCPDFMGGHDPPAPLFLHPWPYPLFLFCDKKVPWVLFENYEIHPPTLWVLLGMCSIKKRRTLSNRGGDLAPQLTGAANEASSSALNRLKQCVRRAAEGGGWVQAVEPLEICRVFRGSRIKSSIMKTFFN